MNKIVKRVGRMLGFPAAAFSLCCFYPTGRPQEFVKEKPSSSCSDKNKVAIVFTGTPDRYRAGYDLLRSQKVGNLLLSGISTQDTIQKLADKLGAAPEKISSSPIEIDYSQDTIANGWNAAQWLKGRQACEAVIVDSSAHMERSFANFREAASFLGVKTPITGLYVNDHYSDWKADSKEKFAIGWHRICSAYEWVRSVRGKKPTIPVMKSQPLASLGNPEIR